LIAKVVQILIAASPESAMELREEVRAVPGRGLDGDRYFVGRGTFSPAQPKPDYELTLIEKEKIEEFAHTSNLPFTGYHARRNIVTERVLLNDLAGKEFLIGNVRIRGIRLCEPCDYLATT
jgi:MOSC domain-containing protein YiiM